MSKAAWLRCNMQLISDHQMHARSDRPPSVQAPFTECMRLCAVLDVMRRLLQPKNIMVSAHARTKEYDKSKYISILNIIQVYFPLSLLRPQINTASLVHSLPVAIWLAKFVIVSCLVFPCALLVLKLFT